MKKRLLLTVFGALFVFVVLTTGCDLLAGAPGQDGADGRDGVNGLTLYLVDDSGTRYYSGGSVFLGEVEESGGMNGFPQTLTLNLSLVNDTGRVLTFNGTPELAYEWGQTLDQYMYLDFSTTTEMGNELSVTSAITGTLSAGAVSAPIVCTMDVATLGSTNSYVVRRRYIIELTDGIENYDFVFEVFGYILTSYGWGGV